MVFTSSDGRSSRALHHLIRAPRSVGPTPIASTTGSIARNRRRCASDAHASRSLRQLGQAFSEDTADHGHYPAAEMEVTDGSGRVIERKRWYHALGPYLDSGPRAWSSGQGRVQVDPVTGQASGIVLPSEDDTDPSAFSPVLRCPTAGHWAVGRNGAYGYKR